MGINMKRQYLAMDYGGSSGRGMLGTYDGEKIALLELLRFPDYYVEINRICYWDTYMMFQKLKEAIAAAGARCEDTALVSVGIDTWGTDYGLLDSAGNPIGTAVCERNTEGVGKREVSKLVGEEELYRMTGTHSLNGNTLFQLYERKLRRDISLEYAGTLLMLPDLLGYFLTGRIMGEYSNAATTMILDTASEKWNKGLLRQLGLPDGIFPQVVHGGVVSLPVKRRILEELQLSGIQYTPVLSHDTASAIAAVPHISGQAFCSSGTWSIMGMVTKNLLINETARKYNFASSWLWGGLYKTHRDFMGMWILSQCKKEWEASGKEYTWDDIVREAAAAKKFQTIIDVDREEFFNGGNMREKISSYCRQTHQKEPEGIGQISRCLYESLALRYRRTLRELEEITGERITSLRIIGGGSKNRFFNQMAADALGITVVAGPSEAACLGNVLMQMIADGQMKSLEEGWEVAKRSFPVETYDPKDTKGWQEHSERYRELICQKDETE